MYTLGYKLVQKCFTNFTFIVYKIMSVKAVSFILNFLKKENQTLFLNEICIEIVYF